MRYNTKVSRLESGQKLVQDLKICSAAIGLELTNQGLDFLCSFGDHYRHDVIEGAHELKLFGSWRTLERRVILHFDTGL